MADKKALLVLAQDAAIDENGPAARLFKKGAVFGNYSAGQVLDGSVADENITRQSPEEALAALENAPALTVVDFGGNSAKAEEFLGKALDEVDRKTVLAVIAKDKAIFYGLGINGKAGAVARQAKAADILPTLAYIADFPLTESCTGAIIYQALKTPNMKMEELGKLKAAIERMESALNRENREPWDKHDCA